MESLLHHLLEWARVAPDKIFVRHRAGGGEDSITLAAMASAVEAQAGRLIAFGVRQGDRIPLVADNGIAAMTAFLAVMRAGAVPAFMPFPNPKQDMATFWQNHAPVFARLDAPLTVVADAVDSRDCPHPIRLSELARVDLPMCPLPPLPGRNDPALLQHSSGTTGLKKGIELSHGAILAQADAYSRAIGFGPDDVVASWLPLYHDMGLMTGFLLPLAAGAQIVSMSPFEWVARPAMLMNAIADAAATFCWLPNFAFIHLARTVPARAEWNLVGMRAFISCSEPAHDAAFAAFLDRFGRCGVTARQLRVCYALAENVFAATQTGEAPRPIPHPAGTGQVMECGPPIAGVELRIAEPDADGIGEILLRGDCLFTGYFREPELTAERLVDGWYRTGDMGFLDGGRLFVTGRRDDRIIAYGRNIHAYDLEAVVNTVAGVIPGRSVALGVPDPKLGTCEIVVVAETERMDDPDLRRHIRQTIQDRTGITVRRVILTERGWLVKTTSGKVSREGNMQKYLRSVATMEESNRA